MSIIKCPECQNEVSDTTANCPNCGYSLDGTYKVKYNKTDKKQSKKFLIIIICVFVVCLSGIAFTGAKFYNDKQEATTVNKILEDLTVENVKNMANNLMPYGQIYNVDINKVDEAINNFQKVQHQYDSLNKFQKKYITDIAKNNVKNIENGINICEQLKQMKQVYEKEGIKGLLK